MFEAEQADWRYVHVVHVVPLFGREHTPSKACWCQPEPDEQNDAVMIHHPEQ